MGHQRRCLSARQPIPLCPDFRRIAVSQQGRRRLKARDRRNDGAAFQSPAPGHQRRGIAGASTPIWQEHDDFQFRKMTLFIAHTFSGNCSPTLVGEAGGRSLACSFAAVSAGTSLSEPLICWFRPSAQVERATVCLSLRSPRSPADATPQRTRRSPQLPTSDDVSRLRQPRS